MNFYKNNNNIRKNFLKKCCKKIKKSSKFITNFSFEQVKIANL